MSKTIIQQLADYGQSIWLDYISRSLLETGRLKSLIDSGLRGMTSNPTIFNQAISTSKDYDSKIVKLLEAGKNTFEIYDELTIRDIQEACDAFKNVYEKTDALDGYVSLEINPKLAMNTDESIKEGKRLFQKVQRPNVMIKVPSTKAGFSVIEELLADGINVNVTLIFSLEQYDQTAQAYFKGMDRLAQKQKDLSRTRSVASVFVSRIDTTIDKLLDEKKASPALKGKSAVANSQLIFEKFQTLFAANTFKALFKNHAQPQRVLWASTGTKNPAYSDIKYVTELISKPTVNTLPENTLNAVLNHGVVTEALIGDVKEAKKNFNDLKAVGIDVNQVCAKLLTDGVAAFEKSFDELLDSIKIKSKSLCVTPLSSGRKG